MPLNLNALSISPTMWLYLSPNSNNTRKSNYTFYEMVGNSNISYVFHDIKKLSNNIRCDNCTEIMLLKGLIFETHRELYIIQKGRREMGIRIGLGVPRD